MINAKKNIAINFEVEPFTPHPLMRNAHMQTVGANVFRSFNALPPFRRVRLDTPDDDFLDIDFVEIVGAEWETLGDEAPILFNLHGLEGDARRGYAIDLYKMASKRGYRCVGINYRSCSGEMNRQPRFYHMGATEDVHFVVQYLLDTFPDAPIVMVGTSLGGNILLKYFGEQGVTLSERIVAGATISPVIVATGKQRISDEFVGRIYGGRLLSKLQVKVRTKADMLYQTPADPYAALKAKTIREFDDAITAPLHHFKDAQDYYGQCNSVNFLGDIQRPTLLMRSYDDPFFNPEIPHEIIAQNPLLVPAFTEHGGHVGFIEGATPFTYTSWAPRQALRFFDTVLDR